MSLDDRNDELDKKLQENPIDKIVAALVRSDQRRKFQIMVISFSLVFDLLVSVALAFGWHQNHELAIKAESNHNAIVRSCETSNDARARNKKLWDYILTVPSSQPMTPEREKAISDFKKFVDKTFAPRDCSKIE